MDNLKTPEEWLILADKYPERAYDTIEEAKLLKQHQCWVVYLNRLYYACFYGAMALHATEHQRPNTHRGTRTLFHRLFVRDDKFPRDEAQLLRELGDPCNKTDYDAIFEPEPEYIAPLLSEAEHFVEISDELVNAS